MIHVLQTGNERVYRGICLNVLTMLKFTKEPIHLHIMTMEISWSNVPKISEEQADVIRKVMKEKNPLNEVSYYDVSEEFENTFKYTPNKKPTYSPASLIRLLFPKYIDCDYLIYLDSDTLTASSLEAFKEIDISDKEMAVTLDYMGRFWVKRDYFNSGMLYINVKRVKETKLFENAVELLKHKKYFFADQTALYKLCKEKVYVPFRFNEQRDVKEDTVIKHFNKAVQYLPYFCVYNVKQWNVKKVHSFLKMHYFDDIFEMYPKVFPNAEPLEY